ncbi:thermonuclease family protein [Kaistella sp. DKR-2]|uniref:thermonuclease family protein n=1 Tax=Kaistella soli TaxID=2849654 RepID=UPI001C251E6B|nr:thermonuclease family protein [Kaistella soli]MBU8881566.1 thermonuclease family protein [Kaistella soli]
MIKFLGWLFFLLPIFMFSQTYKVIKIKDGDTVCILMNGKEEVIRLAHIDCPEKKQPFGNKAKVFISDLCFGKYVSIGNSFKRDRNKRIIAEIILPNGVNVNKELVKNGLAWHFKKYSKDSNYAKLEIEARRKKAGLWKDKDPIAPWNWRKLSKPALRQYSYSAF